MKSELLDFNLLKEEITPDNVLAISELIALTETRFLIGYMGSRMQKLYADLYADITHKNEANRVFSDGYDLVQEGALYLCEHYGKHLNDVIPRDRELEFTVLSLKGAFVITVARIAGVVTVFGIFFVT